MNIRLKRAKLDDLQVYKKYILGTAYHWFYGNTSRLERRDSIKHEPERRVLPPRKRKDGKEIPSAREKNLNYGSTDFQKDLGMRDKKIDIIYSDNEIIGFIKYGKINSKQIRIYEFALEIRYQNKTSIRNILDLISIPGYNFYILVADRYACNILKSFLDVTVDIERS
jgi:hypothetical protein